MNIRPASGVLVAMAVVLSACTGPILANPPVERPTGPPPSAAASRPSDPVPVVLPRDDGPHDRLTEWWYYTGHLRDPSGARFGFEYVIFRAERGHFPVTWASHLALTDESGGRFRYAQRTEIGPQVDATPGAGGFELALADWTMAGGAGNDRLHAVDGTGFGIDLALEATRPAALHDEDGWIDFGPAGGSYYYSRTRMNAAGSVVVDGRTLAVEGTAWFDHQWGDFIAIGGGGWDWFAVNLDDGSDLTLSLVRDADGSYPLVYGTLVEADGTVRHLRRETFSIDVTDRWTSPTTGADYPAGWRIEVPDEELTIDLRPTVADQELDTRSTTGVVYWEGSQVVDARRGGRRVGGEAYVELTGYAVTAD